MYGTPVFIAWVLRFKTLLDKSWWNNLLWVNSVIYTANITGDFYGSNISFFFWVLINNMILFHMHIEIVQLFTHKNVSAEIKKKKIVYVLHVCYSNKTYLKNCKQTVWWNILKGPRMKHEQV